MSSQPCRQLGATNFEPFGPACYREAVDSFQEQHRNLQDILDKMGSLVLAQRTEEIDGDSPPHEFTHHSVAEYIFPPQETDLLHNCAVVGQDSNYSLVDCDEAYTYDPELVEGHLKITYDDAHDPPHMVVEDLLGHSVLPAQVTAVIRFTFEHLPVHN